MTSRFPDTVNFSLLLGPSFGTLLCAALLAAFLWHYRGGLRYRYALCYYLCIALMLGVSGLANNSSGWLLSPSHIILLLLCVAGIAGTALCLAMLYPYRPLPLVRRTLQLLLVVNGLALMATAVLPPHISVVACFASAFATCLVAAIASASCNIKASSREQPSQAFAFEHRSQGRPLALFGFAWIAITSGMLMYALSDALQDDGTRQITVLLLALNLQLLLISLALLDQAWLEHQSRIHFQQQATEHARHLSAKMRTRQQRLTQHNQELRQLLRQGDRLDEVTGLLAARALHRELDREYRIALRYGNVLSLVVLQLEPLQTADDDQDVIDSTEACLAALAQLVSTALQRPGDAAGRITGSHIAVVLPYTNTAGATHVLERITEGVQQASTDPALQDIILRFGVASTETRLARHADDLLESAMEQLSEYTAQPG